MQLRLYTLGLAEFPSGEVAARRPAAPKPPPAYTLSGLRKEHRNSHQRWTPEEDIRLARRARDGATVEELMAEHGRNQGAIIARLGRASDSWNRHVAAGSTTTIQDDRARLE